MVVKCCAFAVVRTVEQNISLIEILYPFVIVVVVFFLLF